MTWKKWELRRRREAWGAELSGLDGERYRAMAFLREHLPESDLDSYPAGRFLRFVDHALALRGAAPWCKALDWEIFAHYVLFPRVNDEDLSFHREIFWAGLWPRVMNLPSQEARILEVNRWCHEQASYQAQDQRTASPLTVYRCGSGRCGEESAFLVSALRSVGIPARQVYAPRWSHCDDNHAWVEALCGETWHFLGACEPEPMLDRGWFLTAASRAVLVHSRIFGKSSDTRHGEPLGPEGAVSWFNQTARYARTQTRVFRALSGDKPAAGARFHLQILNEAGFHTIAVLTAGPQGEARAELGEGSLHVFAEWNGLCAEGTCHGAELVLRLAPKEIGDTAWSEFDFYASRGRINPPPALSGELKAERAAQRRLGDGLRQEKMAQFPQNGPESSRDLRLAARGNSGELAEFLTGERPELRERLARTLADKDLRDVSRKTLEDHFAHLPPRLEDVPEEIYWSYAACPRVDWEPLTPWRSVLCRWLTGWSGSPAALWRRLKDELQEREPAFGGLYWTPESALAAGGCDERSRRLLWVAALRTLGVPARLRPLDGAPEYWSEGRFQTVQPEETGILHITCPDGQRPNYGQDWTISQWKPDIWTRLQTAGDRRDGAWRLELPAGLYRLTTSVRLPEGDQLAASRELLVRAGEERTVSLVLRPWLAEQLLSRRALPAVAARTLEGIHIPDLFRTGDGPVLALWLEEGSEPTEHLLNELLERGNAPVRTLFLVRGQESLAQPTLNRALERLEGTQAMLCGWTDDLESVARHLGRDPDSPPLAVLCDGEGYAVYSASGYRAGGVELLVRAARAWLERNA